MADEKRRCKGISRQSGERCKCKAVKGSNYCMFHGGGALGNKGGAKKGTPKPPGAGGPAWGNTNAVKHGAYSVRLLPEEQPYFEAIRAAFVKDLGGDEMLSEADRLLVFRLAVNAAKLTSAIEKGAPPDAVAPCHRLELDLLRELKATRATKGDPSAHGTSPAELVTVIMAQVRQRGIEVRPMPVLPPTEADGDVIEVDAVEDDERGTP